jgi:glutathione synthase/RimK-type ligase-like ATP-grasp enzyme
MLVERGSQNELKDILKRSNWEVAIVKPTIGAGASGVFTVSRAEAETKQQIFDSLVRKSDVLIQPFMEEVQVEGEYSFIFFNGECNHVMLKRQRQNNFNVNAGYLTPVQATKHLISQANRIYRRLPSPVLYARLDVLNVQGKLVLVEAELIEPILFFRWCSKAPDRFAKAIQQAVT